MTSVDRLETADCEEILIVRDRAAAAVVVVAVHDTRLGPAHGGIRRWPYRGLADAIDDLVQLAEAMTWKCALAGIAAGGGKAVILDHPGLDRPAAYRLVGRLVEQLGGRFFTGPDVGTTPDDLRIVAEQTRLVATGADEGSGDFGLATATGVAAAIGALAERLPAPLAGLRVAVQGLGTVGMQLCALLHEAGAHLVVADALAARANSAVEQFGAEVVAVDRIADTPCDVFAPCALGAVLTEAVAGRLPARGVCGAANNIFADDAAAQILHDRGVLVVPDFVANAGALIAGATWHLHGERVGLDRLRGIGATAGELLDRARAENVPPHRLALRVAKERLERAGTRVGG
jgi:leucine dehydrogenase